MEMKSWDEMYEIARGYYEYGKGHTEMRKTIRIQCKTTIKDG